MRVNYFHRIDDVGENSTFLNEVLDIFEKLNENLYLAIIPTQLSSSLADRISNSRNIIVMQHGFKHTNNSALKQKDEFPDCMRKQIILKNIKEGNEILQQMLKIKVGIYCPPWNYTSRTALEVIEKCGFNTVSGHDSIPLDTNLPKLNVNIDSARAYRPITLKNHHEILAEVNSSRAKTKGLMYHLDGLSAEDEKSLKYTIISLCKYLYNEYR